MWMWRWQILVLCSIIILLTGQFYFASHKDLGKQADLVKRVMNYLTKDENKTNVLFPTNLVKRVMNYLIKDGNKTNVPFPTLKNCPKNVSQLYKKAIVNLNIPTHDELIGLSVDFGGQVEKGGWWTPRNCTSTKKVAIIVPFRNRTEHLKIFLRHFHPLLQQQLLDYRIFVVEQLEGSPFNRATLFNIGFVEALKISPFNCFIFTDVDLLPEDYRNYHGCPTSPRHMAVAVDIFDYHLAYDNIFGGAAAFTKEDFQKINGMSNLYFGRGVEDDDLFKRVERNFTLTRPAMKIARYTMIKEHHVQDTFSDANYENSNKLYEVATKKMDVDGLNSLKYKLKEIIEEPLVTFFKVEVNMTDYHEKIQHWVKQV